MTERNQYFGFCTIFIKAIFYLNDDENGYYLPHGLTPRENGYL